MCACAVSVAVAWAETKFSLGETQMYESAICLLVGRLLAGTSTCGAALARSRPTIVVVPG